MKNYANDFDWSKYENYKGGSNLTSNPQVKGQDPKNVCYSREPYAQQMFDLLTSKDSKIVKKDLVKGDCVPITDMYNIRDDKMIIELLGGLTVEIDLSREKRFLQMFGYESVDDFSRAILNKDYISKFLEHGLVAYIIESSPSLKVSLWQGYLIKIKDEFMKEIHEPSKAYVAKILEANKGGYFVEVQGVEAFMPGSLAAPNKIVDFRSLVGKEVIVMIEDFLNDMNSFIVSHKKYIEYILPKKIAELDLNEKYVGTITGTSKYGIFIEFNEIFTGLLHNSKMKGDTLVEFRKRNFKAGDEIEFFINEITKDNRIILTEESPIEKEEKLNTFIKDNENKIIEGEVAAIMNFGVIVNVDDLSGLIPSKEFRKNKVLMKNFVIGDKINVKISEFKDKKIVFDLYTKKEL